MRKVYFWAPTIFFMMLIFFLSSRERVQVSDIYAIQFAIFKTLHILEYGLLYILLYRSFRNTTFGPDWKHRVNAFIIALFYGISDEIHQVVVPTREGKMRDIVIDVVGISIAAVYLWKYLPKAPRKLIAWAKRLQII